MVIGDLGVFRNEAIASDTEWYIISICHPLSTYSFPKDIAWLKA